MTIYRSLYFCLCSWFVANCVTGAPSAESGLDYQGIVGSADNRTILSQIVTNWTRDKEFHPSGYIRVTEASTGREIWSTNKVFAPLNEMFVSDKGDYVLWIRRTVSIDSDRGAPATNTPVIRLWFKGELIKEVSLTSLAFDTSDQIHKRKEIYIQNFGFGCLWIGDDSSPSMAYVLEQLEKSQGHPIEPVFGNSTVSFILLDRKVRTMNLRTGEIKVRSSLLE